MVVVLEPVKHYLQDLKPQIQSHCICLQLFFRMAVSKTFTKFGSVSFQYIFRSDLDSATLANNDFVLEFFLCYFVIFFEQLRLKILLGVLLNVRVHIRNAHLMFKRSALRNFLTSSLGNFFCTSNVFKMQTQTWNFTKK